MCVLCLRSGRRVCTDSRTPEVLPLVHRVALEGKQKDTLGHAYKYVFSADIEELGLVALAPRAERGAQKQQGTYIECGDNVEIPERAQHWEISVRWQEDSTGERGISTETSRTHLARLWDDLSPSLASSSPSSTVEER